VLIERFKSRFLLLVVLVLQAQIHAAVITGQEPVTVNLGSGTNVSYLVFDESSLSSAPIIYAWHYDGMTNSSGQPWSGTDLLQGVIGDSRLTAFALDYSVGAYGLMASFSIGSTSSTIDPLATPVWSYWVKGGTQDAYNDSGDDFTISPASWVVAPNTSDLRWLTNGSYDAWTLSPFSYTGAPGDTTYYIDLNGISQPVSFGSYTGNAPLSAVPEPSPAALFFGFLVILCFKRNRLKRLRVA